MIRSLRLENFTVFSLSEMSFGALNVIHGECAVGKEHLLRLLYSLSSTMSRSSVMESGRPDSPKKRWLEERIARKVSFVFRPNDSKIGRLVRGRRAARGATAYIKCEDEEMSFSFGSRSQRLVVVECMPSAWIDGSSVFIPTQELLTIYPGFVGMYNSYVIAFSETWRDTCLLLGVPLARSAFEDWSVKVMLNLENALGGRVILEDGRFFILGDGGEKDEVDLLAKRYLKLAMVARLIENKSIRSGSRLFWEYPESLMSKDMVKIIAQLLVDISNAGIQVFVVTGGGDLIDTLSGIEGSSVQYVEVFNGKSGAMINQDSPLAIGGEAWMRLLWQKKMSYDLP